MVVVPQPPIGQNREEGECMYERDIVAFCCSEFCYTKIETFVNLPMSQGKADISLHITTSQYIYNNIFNML